MSQNILNTPHFACPGIITPSSRPLANCAIVSTRCAAYMPSNMPPFANRPCQWGIQYDLVILKLQSQCYAGKLVSQIGNPTYSQRWNKPGNGWSPGVCTSLAGLARHLALKALGKIGRA